MHCFKHKPDPSGLVLVSKPCQDVITTRAIPAAVEVDTTFKPYQTDRPPGEKIWFRFSGSPFWGFDHILRKFHIPLARSRGTPVIQCRFKNAASASLLKQYRNVDRFILGSTVARSVDVELSGSGGKYSATVGPGKSQDMLSATER